jgi:hypothetical protein
MDNHIVPISTEIDRFKEHLALDKNIRILFSAPFGAGKSSFIQTFFSEIPGYLVIKIFPTSYSVASNKDIFELIKFDILTSLFEDFSEYLELGEEEFSNFLLGQMFALNKMDLYPLSQSVIKAFIPKAEPGIELINKIKELVDKFGDYKKEIKTTDEEAIIDYLTSLRMQGGSVKEQDFFTQKIKEYLNIIREKSEKQIILVIDDLDRLDADHVFRIFNIFTAHYDSKADSNKFGFDKIVLVCDINTVEHLFFHRYGSKAEFNGYIDKFYSHSIYHFDIKKHLSENIIKLLENKDNLFRHRGQPERASLTTFGFNNSDFYSAFHFLVDELIERGFIKIRNFNRFQEYSLPNKIISGPRGKESSDTYPFLVLISLLSQFFARPIDFELILKNLYEKFPSDYASKKTHYNDNKGVENLLIQFSLPFLQLYIDAEESSTEKIFDFTSESNENLIIVYTSNGRYFDNGLKFLRCLSSTSGKNTEGYYEGSQVNRPNPYWFLYQAYENCKIRKYMF